MPGKKQGFTLLELLMVMAVLAVLMALGTKGYSLARRQAKESAARADLEKWRTALNEYRVEFGRYPVQPAAGPLPSNTDLETMVDGLQRTDPWGRDYRYVCTNRFLYSIWSEGQNTNSVSDNIDPSVSGY